METNAIIDTPDFSDEAVQVLRKGNILAENETPKDMMNRVIHSVVDVEEKFGTPLKEIDNIKHQFARYCTQKKLTLGSPILTNAGRYLDMALSSCIAVPVDVRKPFKDIRETIESYYHQNMGSGFNFSNVNDPIRVLNELNDHAVSETVKKKHARYIGNMGNLDINHPEVIRFITAKNIDNQLSHFNLSVNVTDEFMKSFINGSELKDKKGKPLDADKIWSAITTSAWTSGDPGLLFIDKINTDNPTPMLGHYVTTAPCAEVGLTEGEACVFGYVNLSAFVTELSPGNPSFDFNDLEHSVPLLTRVLDNCLELSIDKYPTEKSRFIMSQKRKIGIGVCGFADMLIKLKLSYGSDEATKLLQNILLTINYCSKLESCRLAETRGSFLNLKLSRYFSEDNFLSSKFGQLKNLRITYDDWKRLEDKIKSTGLLRHASTTALPPSGRSALLVDASTSLEPLFSFLTSSGKLKKEVYSYLETVLSNQDVWSISRTLLFQNSIQESNVSEKIKNVLKKATEIPGTAQINTVAAAIECVDEGASKTINLPSEATAEDVSNLFLYAWSKKLKAISVYRDRTKQFQPQNFN